MQAIRKRHDWLIVQSLFQTTQYFFVSKILSFSGCSIGRFDSMQFDSGLEAFYLFCLVVGVSVCMTFGAWIPFRTVQRIFGKRSQCSSRNGNRGPTNGPTLLDRHDLAVYVCFSSAGSRTGAHEILRRAWQAQRSLPSAFWIDSILTLSSLRERKRATKEVASCCASS